MFTGIIADLGRIRQIEPDGDPRYTIETRFRTDRILLGASIACSGVCLTVIETGPDWFKVQVSAETLGLTTVGQWQVGTRLNLERALCLGDELGGHIVSGHVDGVGTVVSRTPDHESVRFEVAVPDRLAPYIARKGSVAIDGVSLTVNTVEGRHFAVNIIPHTQAETCFGWLDVGSAVNIEIDMLARYVARQIGRDQS